MKNIKLTIEYDGTNYHGWQIQQNSITVQEVVQNAIKRLLGEETSVIGCSRTDVGVHAYGQTLNFMTQSNIPPDKFSFALNNLLPTDIVVRKSELVPDDFHARYNAKGKKYRYLVINSSQPSALNRNRAWHVKPVLDVEKMVEAAKAFLGEHDFAAFQATGGQVRSTVRTIYNIMVNRMPDNIISIEVEGNGFLYNMVRIIAGTLVYVGLGKLRPDEVTEIIESGDRKRAGITAPAHGLYLIEVLY